MNAKSKLKEVWPVGGTQDTNFEPKKRICFAARI